MPHGNGRIQCKCMLRVELYFMDQSSLASEELGVETLNPCAFLQLLATLMIGLARPQAQHLSYVRILELGGLLHMLGGLLLYLPFPSPQSLYFSFQFSQRVVALSRQRPPKPARHVIGSSVWDMNPTPYEDCSTLGRAELCHDTCRALILRRCGYCLNSMTLFALSVQWNV